MQKIVMKDDVFLAMNGAVRNLDEIIQRLLLGTGLRSIDLFILRSLAKSDGMHASELAKSVGREATSFTSNLDALQKLGYIERRADKADRRAVRIYLTQEGREIQPRVEDAYGELKVMLNRIIGPEGMRDLLNTLMQIQKL